MMIRSITLLVIASAAALAQNADSSKTCGRARPLAKCKSWIVTEIGVAIAIQSSHPVGRTDSDVGSRLGITTGFMVNSSATRAIGVTGSLAGTVSLDRQDEARRLEVRYRRWIDPQSGLDLSAGAATSIHDREKARGVTARAGLEIGWIGLGIRTDRLHAGRGRPVNDVAFDIHAGEQAGRLTMALVGIAAVVLLARRM